MMDEFNDQSSPKQNASNRAKGIGDFLLILRDRWLLAITLAVPVALSFVYVKSQGIELYRSNSSFRLIPPPAILNLQKVDRDQHIQGLVAKHLDGLNSSDLRANVIQRIKDNSELKSHLLSPYLKDGMPVDVGSAVSYSIGVSPPTEGRPRFTITSTARSGRGAQIIADLVQSEYEKLHNSRKSQQVENVRSVLEVLLEKSLAEEERISKEQSSYKKKHDLPFLEDEKSNTSARKAQYQSEITGSKLEQIKINSLLRQILQIQVRISAENVSTSSNTIADDIATIKEFFEIDAIENFGSVPSLRQKLSDLEFQRKDYQETGSGYLENHPKMMENARQVQKVKESLNMEVKSAIEDLRDKHLQLSAQGSEFEQAMSKVQKESRQLSEIEQTLKNFDRQRAVVTRTTDQIHKRLNDVRIEQALPSEQEEPLNKESFAYLPGAPFTPDKQKIQRDGLMLGFAIFLIIPFALEFVDNRVKSPWDVEVFIGRELIGGIPKISRIEERERPLIVGNDLDDGLTESFRSMFSKIQMNSTAELPKTILVTSAIPSEGKSLISANLAYSCANHGKKTILIDFDLRRPGLHKFCNIGNEEGLLTLINHQGDESLEDLAQKITVQIHPNLLVLPSGGRTRAATELLESKEFDNVHNALRRMCDVIIIDSPPIGLFPDSLAIARKAEEVLFVSRYGKVSRKVVKNLVENIEETGAKILGLVLNDLPQKKTPGYYYSGYYGYGYFRYKYYNKYYGREEVDTKVG
ncbi:polysaccharide biosynthesis tyrosine autokinase [Opitutales bacterium]|nr:polysaccharide biosynthesis tyrosine autokinase [Opitutales bacterium]